MQHCGLKYELFYVWVPIQSIGTSVIDVIFNQISVMNNEKQSTNEVISQCFTHTNLFMTIPNGSEIWIGKRQKQKDGTKNIWIIDWQSIGLGLSLICVRQWQMVRKNYSSLALPWHTFRSCSPHQIKCLNIALCGAMFRILKGKIVSYLVLSRRN